MTIEVHDAPMTLVIHTGETHCHAFTGPEGPRSLCGVPRSEQAFHGFHFKFDGVCEGCGRPACPTCGEIWEAGL